MEYNADELYGIVEHFCCTYWRETFGHGISCFDNTLMDLDWFLEEDEMLQFVTYVNTTFGTSFSTELHACIYLDDLYKRIVKQEEEKGVFLPEYHKMMKLWGYEE
ncbi:hypothetical protein [Treponema sp.]|uniref:hypothetical protein n=1 Tax=Treponema sp. TaxID=166 RepID=UPI00298D9A6B|nr:hypothetical protein [Treponema sp.]MCQ2242345.1 hypothetical protein [Treponema sp.]